MKIKITVVLFFFAAVMQSQTQFIRKDSVPVFVNSQSLDYAWTGGINYAQFSEIDLNQDGVMDLFVFDRTGNKITTFINTGTPNQVAYVAAMQYVSQFPRMHDWVLLRDYNCDGRMDIFTSDASMIRVYKNISTVATGLQFQQVTPDILADLTPNSTHNINPVNVSWIDIPAIRDVDGDGDLDILNFGLNGIQVEFYKNRSIELYTTCDSLNFVLESVCWGEFTENANNPSITLNTPCSLPPVAEKNNTHNAMLHAGSCLECINVDGDNDQDLLVGDLANVNSILVRNGGSSTYALADSLDGLYPAYDTTMALEIFGCGFHLDVNNDGVRDLIFSPNALNTSENYNSVWYYQNTGSDSTVHAHFIQNNFLQEKMIETGEGAFPVFFDFDSDGDEDLFLGTRGYYNSSGIADCKLACYKNTGTATNPVFTYKTSDFAGIFAGGLNMSGMAPAFGDLDGDSDNDLLIGDVNGKMNFFRKDPGNDSNFVLAQVFYMGIDVGSFATPQIVDVDRDGKNDLLIGEQTGNVNYYHNDGTSAVPVFTLVTPLFGNVIVTQTGFTTGYSTPLLYNDSGEYVLLVGSERGFLFRFDNIDGNLSGNFTLTDSLYVSSYEGGRIAPAAADMNNDGRLDVVIGNAAGGVALFYGDNTTAVEEFIPQDQFAIYPNPASSHIIVEMLGPEKGDRIFTIHDLTGKEIMRGNISGEQLIIPVTFAEGIYIFTVRSPNGFTTSRKLIISR
ncbi:MAG: T9SS type A sorting domain-containing protein [Bacteroidota bacterium]|nr:T9SS type A sorting domain-containing protein [Bacteroidota bacterium]